ncbi:MAG: glycosyltransferase family 4 protein [Anaerolineales bacterium]|nr:glycosyltransferase family 4 protein [Anaerolineales bacterium]
MKIAFITLGYKPLRTSGLDLSGERLVTALLDANHHVTVVAGMREKADEVHIHPNLNIYRIQLDQSDWIGFGYRAAKLLPKLGQFDVIHFWDIHFGWAFRGKFIGSLQHSFHQRLKSLDYAPKKSISWITRFAYYWIAHQLAELPALKRANGLIAGSTTTRDEFSRHYGVRDDLVAIAPHGVDTLFFQPSKNSTPMRRKLGLQDDEQVLLFVGFITRRKGLETLIKALPLIQPTPRLLILGKWRSQTYRREVFSLLNSFERFVLEIGFAPDEEMPEYFSLADVYVSSSFLEGFGLPLAESLACETPVVALDTGSVAEVVGEGGILIKENCPEFLAEGIITLLKDEQLRHKMGKYGRQHIMREFSMEAMLEKTLAAYEKFQK